MRNLSVSIFGSAMLIAAAAAPARAALYMHYNGITGDVTLAGYAGDIELESFSISVSRAISSGTGGSADRESGAPKFSDAAITSTASSASIDLFSESIIGQGEPVNVYITKPVGKAAQVETFAEWDFENALISSFSTASTGSNPEDAYTLNFTKITYKWTNYDTGGNIVGTQTFAYDLATGQSSVISSGDVTGFGFATASPDVVAPEPASIASLLLAGPLLLKRRK